MFWGMSEALDFTNEYRTILKDKDFGTKNELNILLIGACDPDHILKTMAKLYKHKAEGPVPVLNIYMIEACVEIVARNIALLGIALENPKEMSLKNKVHLFMDVYGNALMRSSSEQYLAAKSSSLLKILTDSECLEKLSAMLNIEKLKYRERDGIENAFNFWQPKKENIFQISNYWSDRVRKLLGVRYDYREGQFDWDLNMVLKERGGSQICSQEYRYWRECGIAFTYPEFEYSKPNKTLSAGLARNGTNTFHRGYIGDIQTGPFIAFGLKSSDEGLHKSMHGENEYRSTDITERNLLELFHELAEQTPYHHDPSQSRKYGSVRLKMGERLIFNESNNENPRSYDEPWIVIDGVKINFLSADDIFSIQESNTSWVGFFDMVFVGLRFFSFLKDTFAQILRPPSVLILETKLMTTERKNNVSDFEEKLISFAKSANLEPVMNYNSLNKQYSTLKFKKNQ